MRQHIKKLDICHQEDDKNEREGKKACQKENGNVNDKEMWRINTCTHIHTHNGYIQQAICVLLLNECEMCSFARFSESYFYLPSDVLVGYWDHTKY